MLILKIVQFANSNIGSVRYCSSKTSKFSVVSFYKFHKYEEPQKLVETLKTRLSDLDVKGRIQINSIGINSQICMPHSNLNPTKDTFSETYCDGIEYKIHEANFQVFKKLRITNKKLVDGMGDDFDPSKVGIHISPEKWNEILDNRESTNPLILDIRNKYEWDIGRFKGSEKQTLRLFNQFEDYANNIEETVGKERKILMYCTGGIRCELFSAKLKERGFQDVNQLEGGIINYGLQKDTKHWEGNLFVFDDRLVVPVDGDEESDKKDVISRCWHCGTLVETTYNCANTQCNNVFPACDACALKYVACCSEECSQSEYNYIKRNSKQVHLSRSVGKGDHFRKMIEKL